MNINPGHSVLLGVTGKVTEKLPEPYSQCTDTDPELQSLRETVLKAMSDRNIPRPAMNGEHMKGHEMPAQFMPYMYTSQSCRSACRQRLIWERCSCLDLESKLPFPDVDGSLLCGALAEQEMNILLDPQKHNRAGCLSDLTQITSSSCSHLHKIITDLYCVKIVKRDYRERKMLGKLHCNCLPACHSYEYDVSISDSSWPSPGPETDAAYHKMRDVNWTFSHNAQIMEYFNNASNKNEIMQNFAQVIIYNKHLSISKVVEVAAYSLDNVFADIGNKLWFSEGFISTKWVTVCCMGVVLHTW